jgi:hypothetical protein
MKALQRLPDDKIKTVKRLLTSGVSIREAGRLAGVSYYCAWHVSKGSYDKEGYLYDAFKKKENNKYFSWKNFEIF